MVGGGLLKGSGLNKVGSVEGEMAPFVGCSQSPRCDCGRGHGVSVEGLARNVLCEHAKSGHLLTHCQRIARRDAEKWGAGVEEGCCAAPRGDDCYFESIPMSL